jgi:hypothetical protein
MKASDRDDGHGKEKGDAEMENAEGWIINMSQTNWSDKLL